MENTICKRGIFTKERKLITTVEQAKQMAEELQSWTDTEEQKENLQVIKISKQNSQSKNAKETTSIEKDKLDMATTSGQD